MSALQRFENKLEQLLVPGVFARTFRSAVQPVEIASALALGGRQLRPDPEPRPSAGAHDFHVELAASATTSGSTRWARS